MASILRFNSTDQRITYSTGWTTIYNSGVGHNETHSVTSTLGAALFFLFRGIAHT